MHQNDSLGKNTKKKMKIAGKRRNATKKKHFFCYALSDPRPGVLRPRLAATKRDKHQTMAEYLYFQLFLYSFSKNHFNACLIHFYPKLN